MNPTASGRRVHSVDRYHFDDALCSIAETIVIPSGKVSNDVLNTASPWDSSIRQPIPTRRASCRAILRSRSIYLIFAPRLNSLDQFAVLCSMLRRYVLRSLHGESAQLEITRRIDVYASLARAASESHLMLIQC